MPSPNRPQLARLLIIDAELRRTRRPGEPGPTARRLAESLELHPRTLQRDLDFLRYELRAPLRYEAASHAWQYADPCYKLPFFTLAEGELVSLLSAGLLRQFRGTPLHSLLSAAVRKVAELLPEKAALDLAAVQNAIAATATVTPRVDAEAFCLLLEAASQRRQIEIDYSSARSRQRGWRRVDPYRVALIGDAWQLIAHCHRRHDVLMFNLERLHGVRPTTETFACPESFSLADYLKGAFRSVRGDEHRQYEVAVRFSPRAAPWVRTKQWHLSQECDDLPDGGVTMRFTVTDLREVMRWVLQWGADAEVLSPAELRREVVAEAAQLLERYRLPGRKPRPSRSAKDLTTRSSPATSTVTAR